MRQPLSIISLSSSVNSPIFNVNSSIEDSFLITYAGISVALSLIAFAIFGIYLATALGQSHYALMCLMAAGICDMFDGKIARACKRNKDEIAFGIELDSLVDIVCI